MWRKPTWFDFSEQSNQQYEGKRMFLYDCGYLHHFGSCNKRWKRYMMVIKSTWIFVPPSFIKIGAKKVTKGHLRSGVLIWTPRRAPHVPSTGEWNYHCSSGNQRWNKKVFEIKLSRFLIFLCEKSKLTLESQQFCPPE